MSGKKRFLLTLLALTGLALSVKLMAIYWNVNFNPDALPSFCNINDYIDCDGVAQTNSARFLGIPMALWGIFLYLFLLFMTFVDKLKKLPLLGFLQVFQKPTSYISTIGVLTFFTSAGLASVSIFQIEKICVLCFITYFINLFIAFVARDKEGGFVSDIKNSFVDFFTAIKKIPYLVSFLICCIAFGGFIFAINHYKVFVPKVQPQVSAADKNSPYYYHKLKENPYPANGNILGDKNATVFVHVYTDYYCPHCRVLNIMLHKAMTEMTNIQIIHHDYPLDPTCNKSLRGTHSPNGCLAAQYSKAAEKQNKLWNMASLLFDEIPETEDEIIELAKKIKGIDVEKLKNDAHSNSLIDELSKEVNGASDINATPTMIINTQIYKGAMPYDELINILLDAGGKLKVKSTIWNLF